jgi:hypothetical protein
MLRFFGRAALLVGLTSGLVFCSSESPSESSNDAPSELRSPICPLIVFPVCALDASVQSEPAYAQYGSTYSNGCWARKAGAKVVASGKCPGAHEACGGTNQSPVCAEGYVCGRPAGSNHEECLPATRATRGFSSGGACTPVDCGYWGATCGPAGDGCGGLIQCGDCKSGSLCRGWPSACVQVCKPLTCADYPAGTCGVQGDGCGGTITCGCTAPLVCGANPATPNQCGDPCPARLTCADQNQYCGKTGDGCGGILDCGSCPAPQTCGGGGIPNQCGSPNCTPRTCADVGATCGQQGDGCGGLTPNCGTCNASQTCRGTPSTCVPISMCKPKTCADYAGACGRQADGCGGMTDNCGTCVAPETCGGNSGDGTGVQRCGACGISGYPPCGPFNPPVGCQPGLTNMGGTCR